MVRGDSFNAIPIIDLNDLSCCRENTLSQLRHAIVDVGFLLVKNADFPPETISNLIEILPHLFGISEAEKAQIRLEDSPHFLGYSAVGSEITAGKIDNREQFEFTSDPNAIWSSDQPLYKRLHGPNQYPPSLPEAQPIIEAYMKSMSSFAVRFMHLVAEALNLPRDIFLSFLSAQDRLKVVHYSATNGTHPTQGVGPHKDSSGWWTFLLQASPPDVKGLQVLNKAGSWIDVPNIPGTFVVNIGQAFEVVTLGACKATTHRVLGGQVQRYSIPFFLGVQGDLTKEQALTSLAQYFPQQAVESDEGAHIDSPFLRGNYNTWGEAQLRTKIRSHRVAGKRYYSEVYEQYINDD